MQHLLKRIALITAAFLGGAIGFVALPAPPASAVVGTVMTAQGDNHACVLLTTGNVRCWGRNDQKQLGNSTNPGDNLTPVDVVGLSGVTQITAGALFTCAVVTTGAVKCWGFNLVNQLGYIGAGTYTPTTVAGLPPVAKLAAGSGHTCALLVNATVMCWGYASIGQLGNVPVNGGATPVAVMNLTGVVDIAAGGDHTCALMASGIVNCWGRGLDGELGNTANGFNNSMTPLAVTGAAGVTHIGVGRYHSCMALASSVRCFGRNDFSQLGDSTIVNSPTPVTVPGLTGTVGFGLGGKHSCALLADGTVKCWGSNGTGQLGDGTYNDSLTPKTVGGLSTVSKISASWFNNCAVLLDNSVKCWGSNNRGQIGDNTTNYALVPTTVLYLTGGSPPPPPEYVSINPQRIVDTRVGAKTIDHLFEGTGAVAAGSTTVIPVVGRSITPNNTSAVVLNVTSTGSTNDGFLTVYNCTPTRPNSSNLNYSAGSTVANQAIVQLGMLRDVCIYSESPTHLIVDIEGYFPATAPFGTIDPARLMDTRTGGKTVDHQDEGAGIRAKGTVTQVTVAGRGNLSSTAAAAVLNITSTGSSAGGFITVFPCGITQPNSSTLNYAAGQTIANATISKIGTNGQVCIYADTDTHLLVDVTGYYPSTANFASLDPARVLDSRSGSQTIDHAFEAIGVRATGSVTQLTVTGRGGVPANATTVVLNITVTGSTVGGFVTVFPCGTTQPNASNLNYNAGQTIANGAIAKVGTNGQVCIYTDTATHLIVDVTGYYI